MRAWLTALPPDAPSGDVHAWHLYVLRLADGRIVETRVNPQKVPASTLSW